MLSIQAFHSSLLGYGPGFLEEALSRGFLLREKTLTTFQTRTPARKGVLPAESEPRFSTAGLTLLVSEMGCQALPCPLTGCVCGLSSKQKHWRGSLEGRTSLVSCTTLSVATVIFHLQVTLEGVMEGNRKTRVGTVDGLPGIRGLACLCPHSCR